MEDPFGILKRVVILAVIGVLAVVGAWRYFFPIFHVKGYELRAVKRCDLNVMVLSSIHYDDAISPLDLALGQGAMGKVEVFQHCNFSQSGRFLYAQPKPTLDAYAGPEWSRLVSNNHIIPESDSLRSQLLAVEKGEQIRLQGYLVEITDHDLYSCESDPRKDVRGSPCQVFYVEWLERLSRPSGRERNPPVIAPKVQTPARTKVPTIYAIRQGAHARVKGGKVWLAPGTQVRIMRRGETACVVRTQAGLEAEVESAALVPIR